MIRVDTVNNEQIIMQKVTFLYLFSFGVSFQNLDGQHFGIIFGLGPIELNFTVRLWNGTSE
jgi:hypothetical protein